MSRDTLAGLKQLYEVIDFVLADFNLEVGLPLFLCRIVGVGSSAKHRMCNAFEKALSKASDNGTTSIGHATTTLVGHANTNTHHAANSSGKTWYYDTDYKKGWLAYLFPLTLMV